jgi:hypothetical protein
LFSSQHVGFADIFGSQVIYSNYAAGVTQLQDLALPWSATNPLMLDDAAAERQVAIWGRTVAWVRWTGAIAVRTLPGTATREIPDPGNNGPSGPVRISAGTLSWQDGAGHIWLVDLLSPNSLPVDSGLKGPGEVDDHLVAGVDDQGHIQVHTLPFGQATANQPRLIGTIAATTYSPQFDTWKPQFDTSKPLRQVQLKIHHGTAIVRTLTGSAATGSIRDLSWNGRTGSGKIVPPGKYTWTLTATADDGDGPLTNRDGKSAITGSLTLTR